MFLPVTVERFANVVCSARFLATGLTADLGQHVLKTPLAKGHTPF